jgi:hypothetical protein
VKDQYCGRERERVFVVSLLVYFRGCGKGLEQSAIDLACLHENRSRLADSRPA